MVSIYKTKIKHQVSLNMTADIHAYKYIQYRSLQRVWGFVHNQLYLRLSLLR